MTYSSNEPHTSPSEPPRVPRMVSIALPNYKPVATMVLLVVTVIIYLGQWLSQLAFNGADPLFELGGKINTLIEQGEVWRLITPAFLHASPIHLLFNMYALFVLGRVIEGVYGHSRFLMLYFISAFAGNVASFVLSANNSLGASTAIFGLIGAEAIFVIRNKRFFGNRFNSTLTNIGVIIALNLAIGFLARLLDRLLGTYRRFDRWYPFCFSGRSSMGSGWQGACNHDRRPSERFKYYPFRSSRSCRRCGSCDLYGRKIKHPGCFVTPGVLI